MGILIILFLSLAWGQSSPAPNLTRIENHVDFLTDTNFLSKGGIQLFFELISSDQKAEAYESFLKLRPLDKDDLWSRRNEPLYILTSRLVYEVRKDLSFFSENRLYDESYLNQLLPSYRIKKMGSNVFRSCSAPQNTFVIEYFRSGLLPTELESLGGGLVTPGVAILQHNHDFEKILGFRTALMGRTLTLHHSSGPGRTRIIVWSLSYIHNIPPFFLGGSIRVVSEVRKKSFDLITRLRNFDETWSVQ